VVRNVIDYRAWNLRSKNAQTILDESQQLLELANLQQQAGLFSDSEVTDAEVAVHQAAATMPSLQSAAAAALIALTVLTDQSQNRLSLAFNALHYTECSQACNRSRFAIGFASASS